MARGNFVWYNGKILPVEQAKISLFTHALHYGTGAFEGIRAYKQNKGGGAVFRLVEHIERLFESAKILGFSVPHTVDELVRACTETCKANHFEECYLRPILFVADGPLGVFPGEKPPIDVAILAWEWGQYVGKSDPHAGARLKISSFIRPHVNSSMTKGKITGQYINGVIAKREALALGYDEALMLDAEGYLTEGTGENLFMIKNGTVITTPMTSILGGITRRSIMDYLQFKGIPIKEARFSRDELYCADEVFLTGTAAEITVIQEIDNRKIESVSSRPHKKWAPQIKQDYERIVRGNYAEGEFPFAQNWLTRL